MDFDRLFQKREQLARVWDTIPQVAREKLERSFDIEYAGLVVWVLVWLAAR